MKRYVFLSAATLICAPLLAQTAPSGQNAQGAGAPVASGPAADMSSTAAQPAPVQEPTPAAAAPAAASQVADAVNTDFSKYDADGNGNLSRTEFGSWMVALKTASDASTKAEAAETKTWVGQAFAQADTDKSRSVSKPELTKFLAQGAG